MDTKPQPIMLAGVAWDDDTSSASSSTQAVTPATDSTDAPVVEIHHLPDPGNDGLIIRIEPPEQPQDAMLSHVPCDIALVIDVSTTMDEDAPLPGEKDGGERTGLSVLDLVKHACRTILSTLDENDRLAIVTFSNRSRVLQPLVPMTDDNKGNAEVKIDGMLCEGSTNLWHGLKDGIKLFEGEANTGRVPAVLVLTDGAPNHMCPPQGYVPALRALGDIVPSIHTFGFGYILNSGLLKSIAEFGRGNYSFIPDAGMIGTVFVHAIANLQSTFAIDASLQLAYPDHMKVQQTAGPSVDQPQPVRRDEGEYQLTIPLGNIQYGQSRDIYLRYKSTSTDADWELTPRISATLHYNQMTATQHTITANCNLLDTPLALSPAEVAYHISRHHVLSFLSNLFPIDAFGQHRTKVLKDERGLGFEAAVAEQLEHLGQLVASLPAARFAGDDPRCAALLQDLAGPPPSGQVSLALSCARFLKRWGQHYLPSLHGAHARQLCNSFKDPGPLQYGAGSPLFARCRDRLNAAFDGLPVPTPSARPSRSYLAPPLSSSSAARPVDGGDALRGAPARRRASRLPHSMSSYNERTDPCFAAQTPVRLAGGPRVPIAALERGVRVDTPRGPRAVAAVLVTRVRRAAMVRWRGVLVTPWHPVAPGGVAGGDGEGDGGREGWAFPCRLPGEDRDVVAYTGRIYSVLLQRDADPDAHAMLLGGDGGAPFWGVTLGHGVLGGADPRAHPFLGSYNGVVRSLFGLRVAKGGKFCTGGVKRCKETELVCGFEEGRPRTASARALRVKRRA